MSEYWSQQEVDSIVADYFVMLRAELQNRSYSKKRHRATLMPALQSRSDGSVEFKHQNISAVLINMGLPYIDGYKPRGNYQRLLKSAVDEFLRANPKILDEFAASPVLNPATIPSTSGVFGDDLIEQPPERIVVPPEAIEPWVMRHPCIRDFARQDAENRRLGELGEQFAVGVEQSRLKRAGRHDLAHKVDWVSQTCGDGLGFDILSYDDQTGDEQFIEVKTTALGKYFPFYVTGNELRCSEARPGQFRLYRVFDFAKSPRIYKLSGSLSSSCRLQPVLYRAAMGS